MLNDVDRLIQEIHDLPDDAQRRVRQALNEQAMQMPAADIPMSAEEVLQLRLYEAGLIRDLRRPKRDSEAFSQRKLVTIKGKPLSETIIEDRR